MRDHLLLARDELAHTDVLTGLPNRRAWELELDRGLSRARRTGEALIGVGRAWAEILRPDDVLARIGGDEFVVLLPACPETEGPDVMARLRARMAAQPHESAVQA